MMINWVNMALLCAGWWLVNCDWRGYRLVGGLILFTTGLYGGAVL